MTQVRIVCIIIFLFYTSKIDTYLYERNEFIFFFINNNKLSNTLVLFVSIHYRFVNRLF
jgi:phosphodiesterase/alkaline phosphatase D-like protein